MVSQVVHFKVCTFYKDQAFCVSWARREVCVSVTVHAYIHLTLKFEVNSIKNETLCQSRRLSPNNMLNFCKFCLFSFIDESYSAKHWCIMGEFQILISVILKNWVDVAKNLQCLS